MKPFLPLLKSNEVFSDLNESELNFLVQNSDSKYYSKNENIFLQNTPIKYYYFIISGNVKVFRINSDGEEKTFNTFTQGSLFAEVAPLLESKKYPMSAVATKESFILKLRSQYLIEMLRLNHKFCLKFIKKMTTRIYKQINYIDNLKNQHSIERFKFFLINSDGEIINNSKKIIFKSTKKVLAEQLSISPESLSRCLNKLKSKNIIQEKKYGLLITDWDSLNKLKFNNID